MSGSWCFTKDKTFLRIEVAKPSKFGLQMFVFLPSVV